MGDTYTEDLKVLARSELGKAMLDGATIELLSDNERVVMRQLLARVKQ